MSIAINVTSIEPSDPMERFEPEGANLMARWARDFGRLRSNAGMALLVSGPKDSP
jgi:hypothetical protein